MMPTVMRAGLLLGPHSITVDTLEVPVPLSGQVLLRVRACGLCTSELDVYLGHNPWAGFPMRPGHEVTGEVVAAGRGCDHPCCWPDGRGGPGRCRVRRVCRG